MLEYIGTLVILIIILGANFGGTNGVGVVICLAAVFFKFDTKQSIYLSNFSILFGCLVRYLINIPVKHPLKKWATIVDYDYVIIMLPLIMVAS